MDDHDFDDSFFSCSSESCGYASADEVSTLPTLHDQISSLFADHRNNFNIVHINAQSVPSHYSDLLASFSNANVDALLISETFLKPSLLSTQFSLPGFVLVRNDRTGKGGGGVAIYLRADLPHKIVLASPSLYSESAEYLFLEISLKSSKILLAVFYSPSLRIDYFTSFDSTLNDLCPLYSDTIILGDFNTCLLKNDSRSSRLTSILSSYDLHILPLSATHFSPNCTPSLLDLAVVSSLDKVTRHGQLTAAFSYHDLIYVSYRVRTPRRRAQFVNLRNYNAMDIEALQADAYALDWSPVTDSPNTDDKVSCFNSMVLSLMDKHAPIRRIKIKHQPAPWITAEIRDLMARRDRAKSKYKCRPSDVFLGYYKALRNRCNRLCRDAKRRYFHESLTNRSSSDVWKFLKSVGIGKSSLNSCKDVDLNGINKFFSQSPIHLDHNMKSATLSELRRLPVPTCPPFSFSLVLEADVEKSVLAITSSAVGSDKVCSRMLRPILPCVLPILTHIFNHSLYTCNFPSAWKQAYIIPLPKISNPSLASHFRPISILPFLSKTLEHIVHKQIAGFLTSNSLISTYQSGFRSGHSTVTALLKVTDDIRWAMENKMLTVLVLLDFSSAFNSVDFDVLLGILESLNFSSTALAWIESYLRGRLQCVRLEDSYSDWCDLATGVPQGGVLSPLLFSIFINSITRVISSHFHLYADDLQLYRHFKVTDADFALKAMNEDLASICDWANSFGLKVNPSKSQAIIIGSKVMRSKLSFSTAGLFFDGVSIEYSDTVKNLGIIIDAELTWRPQVAEVGRKVYFSFHSLKSLQYFLPIETKVSLALSMIQPLIDYADACYLDATEELLNKLERLQNLCIRFIFGLRKYDHVSHFRKQLKWLPIRLRRNTRILCLLFNVLHNPTYPSYLRERFTFNRPPDVPCRSHIKSLLHFQPHSTDFYSYSFTVHAVRLWNSLPPKIRDSKSLSLFKKRVKEHYLSSCD